MQVDKKQSQLAYFKFFFSILRLKFFLNIVLNLAIGFLDGLGLTMLIPLLQSIDGKENSGKSLGQLQYFLHFVESLGFQLTINVILIIFLVLFFVKAVLKYIASLYQTKIQNYFVRHLQYQLIRDIRNMSYEGYLKLDAGNLQNVVIGEVWRVSEAMKRYMKWNQSLLMLFTYVSLAFLASPKFAVTILIGVGITNLLYRRFFKKMKAASYELSLKGRDLQAYLIEFVHHFKYLKSTNYINRFSKRLRGVVNETYDLNTRLGKLSSFVVSIKEPMIVFIVVGVIFLQINWIGGEIGSIMLSLLLFYRGLNHLMGLQNEWQSFLYHCGAFQMVQEVQEKIINFQEKNGGAPFETFEHEIRLQNISLTFGRNKILENINLSIPKNSTIAFVGASGSGKTTLVNIITGLLKPVSGNVLIDNHELSDTKLEDYRNKIGYISQESVVFNDTIYNNITFWEEPTAENMQRFWRAVHMASLTDFIETQELKEHTLLGDNGILISGGQRQRISIARELFKGPEILILDEATSALDSETEQIIQQNIESMHGHYTMVIIAHRLSTVKYVDQIFLLEKGKIVHSGRFDEMIVQSHQFRNLVTLQGLTA